MVGLYLSIWRKKSCKKGGSYLYKWFYKLGTSTKKLTDNFVLIYFDLENFLDSDLFSNDDSKLLLTPSESWKKSWWRSLKEKIHTLHDLLGLYIKLLTTYDNNFFY